MCYNLHGVKNEKDKIKEETKKKTFNNDNSSINFDNHMAISCNQY